MNEEMQEQLAMMASFIDVPWEAAAQQAANAHIHRLPSMMDIVQARAYMRVMEAKAIIALIEAPEAE